MNPRVYRIALALAALGLAVAAASGGATAAIGWAAGAGYSILSFRFLDRVVTSLGTDKPRRVSGTLLALRFLLLGGLLYVIVKYSESSLPAALCGIFVAFAAVLAESIYQVYARTS